MTTNLTENTFIKYDILPEELKMNDKTFDIIWALKPQEEQQVKIFGKLIDIPRKNQAYGISYNFAGITVSCKPIPNILQPYLDFVNKSENEMGYNMILVNWYDNGDNYIGYHSDDVRQLVPNSSIYNMSFGAIRTFKLQSKCKEKNTYSYELENNSYLVMGGFCQSEFKHCIIKTKKIVGKRISLTFRKMIL